MTKIDFKKTMKDLYQPPSNKFSVVDVPAMNFLMLDGYGDPNLTPDYQVIMTALYAVAYKIKFMLKLQNFDYVVPPLEGLWWMEDMREFTLKNKSRWNWTMMIMQPEMVDRGLFQAARQEVAAEKNLPAVARMRLERYEEGPSVQILYYGPYEEEAPVIARMHEFIKSEGFELTGKHHEIYLSNPQRTSPEKLKTILRQPVQATG